MPCWAPVASAQLGNLHRDQQSHTLSIVAGDSSGSEDPYVLVVLMVLVLVLLMLLLVLLVLVLAFLIVLAYRYPFIPSDDKQDVGDPVDIGGVDGGYVCGNKECVRLWDPRIDGEFMMLVGTTTGAFATFFFCCCAMWTSCCFLDVAKDCKHAKKENMTGIPSLGNVSGWFTMVSFCFRNPGPSLLIA